MASRFTRFLAIFTFSAICAHASAQQLPARVQPVGMVTVHYEDDHRRNWDNTGNRPLNTTVWYPAVADAKEAPLEIAIFKAGKNAGNAAMAASPDKLPLILLSHGTGGAGVGLSWLGEALAAQGYIVAAVNHHGNTGAEPTPMLQGTLVWWDRPQDLSVLVDRLAADPRFGARIDMSRIGVAGFSIGGYTALASVGARLSYDQWRKFCAASPDACALPPEIRNKFSPEDVARLVEHDKRIMDSISHMGDSYSDPRFRSAFIMAPVVGPAMTKESLSAITVPVYIVVGSRDDQAIPEYNAKPVAALIPGAELHILPDVTHYTFLPICNEQGNKYAKELCGSPPGVDRKSVHEQVTGMAVGFFNHTLKQ